MEKMAIQVEDIHKYYFFKGCDVRKIVWNAMVDTYNDHYDRCDMEEAWKMCEEMKQKNPNMSEVSEVLIESTILDYMDVMERGERPGYIQVSREFTMRKGKGYEVRDGKLHVDKLNMGDGGIKLSGYEEGEDGIVIKNEEGVWYVEMT